MSVVFPGQVEAVPPNSNPQKSEAAPLSEQKRIASGVPRHVAIIPDGNGRWAKKRFLPRTEGHRAGGKTVRMLVEECRRLGVRYLTIYAFSSENWQRPALEVGALMKLFESYLTSETELLRKNNIRLRIVGDKSRLPAGVQASVQRCEDATKDFDGMDLILAVSYGGRQELVHAMQKLARRVSAGELQADQISEASITSSLYAPDVPDPDVLIRTSEEMRISNFLLWQMAYTEIVTSCCLWPDFSKEELSRCLAEFSKRHRRFGRTAEQEPTVGEATVPAGTR